MGSRLGEGEMAALGFGWVGIFIFFWFLFSFGRSGSIIRTPGARGIKRERDAGGREK
jgi:hypothetical protein